MILEIPKVQLCTHTDTFKLTEDYISLTTKLSAKLDSQSSTSEYYSYIDNIISYFTDRQVAILTLGRKQIDMVYSNRRQLMKNIDKIKYPIQLRKPNFKYFKLPMIDKVIYSDSITKWSVDNNDKLYIYANIYSPVYNGVVKNITNSEIKQVNKISDLYDIITDTIIIKDSKDMTNYLNNIVIPKDDLDNINKIIDSMISSLKILKTKSVSDIITDNIEFENKINFCIKMIDIKTMYVKGLINILLDIYNVKMNLCIVNGVNDVVTVTAMNESMKELSMDRRIYNESIVYLNEAFDEELLAKANKLSKDAIKIQLNLIWQYVEGLRVSALKHIDKYYRFDSLTGLNMFNITDQIEQTGHVDTIIDYARYIQDNLNISYYNDWASSVFLDPDDTKDREILISRVDRKDKIIEAIEYNYKKIVDHISVLKDSDGFTCSKLFKRNYTELPIYAKEEMEIINNYLSDQYDITIPYGFIYDINCQASIYRDIDNRVGHRADVYAIIERYIKLNKQYNRMFYLIPDEYNIAYHDSVYIDDKLFAYILYFQKQVMTINIV